MRSLFVSGLGVAVLLAAAALAGGCQSAPQVASARGPESGALTGGVMPSAPVDQHGSLIVAPTVVVTGAAAADGKMPTVTVTVGPHADGDVRALGRQEGGAQSATQGATQTSTPTQTTSIDPAAIAKAAGELLATVTPGGEAAKLAQAAADAAGAGKGAEAAELLTKAKSAAVVEKTPPH